MKIKQRMAMRTIITLLNIFVLLSCTTQSARIDNNKRDVLFTLGNNYVKAHNYQQGLEVYLQLVKNNHRDSKVISNMGYILNSTGQHKTALICYKKASRYSRRQDIPLLNNIAITYAVLGYPQTALHILKKINNRKTPYHAIIEKTYYRIATFLNELKLANKDQGKINILQQGLIKELIPQHSAQAVPAKLVQQIGAFCQNS